MPLGPEYGEVVADDVMKNPEYARALLGRALTLLLDGDTSTAKIMFRDLVNGTLGFISLARETGLNDKSLHRMLGANGNPRMENLVLIAQALKKALGVETRVEASKATGKKTLKSVSPQPSGSGVSY